MPKCTTRGCRQLATWEIEIRRAGAKYETYYELGIVLLATGVAAVIIGGIWCGEESERDVVEER